MHEKERYLNYLLSAQRLVGVTADVVGKGKVRIRYETCYKGNLIISHGKYCQPQQFL